MQPAAAHAVSNAVVEMLLPTGQTRIVLVVIDLNRLGDGSARARKRCDRDRSRDEIPHRFLLMDMAPDTAPLVLPLGGAKLSQHCGRGWAAARAAPQFRPDFATIRASSQFVHSLRAAAPAGSSARNLRAHLRHEDRSLRLA